MVLLECFSNFLNDLRPYSDCKEFSTNDHFFSETSSFRQYLKAVHFYGL